MAVFVDLSDDAEDEAVQDADARYAAESVARVAFETGGLGGPSISAGGEKNGEVEEVVNRNRNSVTQVFGCYPYVPSPTCPNPAPEQKTAQQAQQTT
jgi:hypothetical protein